MMHSSPIVSVLVPTYNRVPFLDACLDSVLAQDFDGFEIVISDDASDDEATWDLCQEYGHCDRRIRLVRNPTNLGVVNNVRRCLAEARAPIAKFMLSDDLLYPGALTALVEPLLDDRSLVAVTSKWNMIDGHDGQIPLTAEWDLGVYDDRLFGPDDLGNTILMRFCNLIGTPSQVAFRRDRLDPARIDRVADQVFPLVFDVVMWLRLLREGPLLFRGDRCLSAFRIHDASIGVRNAVRVLLELWRLQRAARSLGYLSTAEKHK